MELLPGQIEQIILDQVKFLNIMLEQLRKRNKLLDEKFGIHYAKMIGLGTPFEELIHHTRNVKSEFDSYLKIIRDELIRLEKKRAQEQRGKSKRRKFTSHI